MSKTLQSCIWELTFRANCCVRSKDLIYFCLFSVLLFFLLLYTLFFFSLLLLFFFLPYMSLAPVFSLNSLLLIVLFTTNSVIILLHFGFPFWTSTFLYSFPLTLCHFSKFSLFVSLASCPFCFSFRMPFFPFSFS